MSRARGWARTAVRRARALRHPTPRLSGYAPRSTLRLPRRPVTAAAVPAIDVHNHLGRWLHPSGGWMAPDVGRLLAEMDGCNLQAVVNLDGRWGPELIENLERYDRRHPGRFATFCHVDWSLLQRPGGGAALARSLRESVDAGARGLKVWKDLGLQVRRSGDLVLPDDPELDELWSAAGELRIPVLIHVADPLAFFDPVDRHNERLEELLRSPRSSWARLGRPHRERLVGALDRVVARHPDTTWIAAHVAAGAEDLDGVGAALARRPNLTVDIAARLGDLGRQPRAAARLITEHPGRVLFGTDVFPFRTGEVRLYLQFLETGDENFDYSTAEVPPSGRWRISGVDLPDDVLRQVYRDNALRLVPGLT